MIVVEHEAREVTMDKTSEFLKKILKIFLILKGTQILRGF